MLRAYHGGLFFRYLAERLRHRDPAAARYLRQGLGIAEREKKLHKYWLPHLERTKAAQRRWAESLSGSDLAVLGAGRLFDFAADTLPARFKRLLLFDADPSCAERWHTLSGVQIEPLIGDLTGCIQHWQQDLDRFYGGWDESLAHIAGIVQPADHAMLFAADAVLSLNLMSQLPIAWQDCVEDYLSRKFGERNVAGKESEWLLAAEPGAQWIVEQHLASLAVSGAGSILLVTDVEYAEYRGGPNSVRWNQGVWDADAGLRVDVTPALYGLDPIALLPDYTLRWQESWLWDISPIGVESATCGTTHRVAAMAFDRNSIWHN